MDIAQEIRSIVESNFQRDDLYIVDLTLSGTTRKKLSITLDGELESVTIDECAKISRIVGDEIEERNLIDDAYHLEVSSPGVDQPLASPRQFKKNIGRDLVLILQDGKEVTGMLEEASDDKITLREIKMRGKLKGYAKTPMEIELNKIDKANILISFN